MTSRSSPDPEFAVIFLPAYGHVVISGDRRDVEIRSFRDAFFLGHEAVSFRETVWAQRNVLRYFPTDIPLRLDRDPERVIAAPKELVAELRRAVASFLADPDKARMFTRNELLLRREALARQEAEIAKLERELADKREKAAATRAAIDGFEREIAVVAEAAAKAA